MPAPLIEIVACAFVALTVFAFLFRDLLLAGGADTGFGLFFVFMLSAVLTAGLIGLVEAFKGYPSTTATCVGLACIAGGWVWLVAHAERIGPFIRGIASLASQSEARQRKAARELAETEKKIAALKADPYYTAALREVESVCR